MKMQKDERYNEIKYSTFTDLESRDHMFLCNFIKC